MLLSELTSSGGMQALELSLRFAAQRQRLLAHNIANLTTPGFQPRDVSPQTFQKALREAVDRHRNDPSRPVSLMETREIAVDRAGALRLTPRTPSGGMLRHDRNSSDLERTMQDLAENSASFRVASDLLKSRHDLLRLAIGQRAA